MATDFFNTIGALPSLPGQATFDTICPSLAEATLFKIRILLVLAVLLMAARVTVFLAARPIASLGPPVKT